METPTTDRMSTPSENALDVWLEKTTEGIMKGARETAIVSWLLDCGFSQDSALFLVNKARDDLMSTTVEEISKRLLAGTHRANVVVSMVQLGWEVNTASVVVNHTANIVSSRLKDIGAGLLLRGLLWAGGGALVSVLSYRAALSSGGGTYLVTTGAFLYGAYCIIKGLTMKTHLP